MENWEKELEEQFGKKGISRAPLNFSQTVMQQLPKRKEVYWKIPAIYGGFILVLLAVVFCSSGTHLNWKTNVSLPQFDFPLVNSTVLIWVILVCWLFVTLDRFLHQRAILTSNNS